MAIDLKEGGRGFLDLLDHYGHNLEVIWYGDDQYGGHPIEVAESIGIECHTCQTVLVDFNRPPLHQLMKMQTPILYWWPKPCGISQDQDYHRAMCDKFKESDLFPNHNPDPRECQGRITSQAEREAIALWLQKPTGKVGYRGMSSCRICGVGLGSHDFSKGMWKWPEKAEHYVLEHGVWIPEFGNIIDTVIRS